MNTALYTFATRLREWIVQRPAASGQRQFADLALELFALQFANNSAYRRICEVRQLTPTTVQNWTQIPAVPTAAFKELELTSLAPDERSAVFHSSGTSGQKPSRHFHGAASLALYEASLWQWFLPNTLPDFKSSLHDLRFACLTPPSAQVPHSSLVHMFRSIQCQLGDAGVLVGATKFHGKVMPDGGWALEFDDVREVVAESTRQGDPVFLLGTAFSFVQLLDFLVENNLRFQLPAGSRVLETGGYKNRSRVLPKAELHALITERLGVPGQNIICEYGMSELSSQAYDREIQNSEFTIHSQPRPFHFPPWSRVQIISPETGREVAEGETGLIRVFDLANVFSVAAIQTEDLGIRRGDGFELIGRAQLAEPRGCSLMTM